MNKYEAMFILKADLPETERKALFTELQETVTKNSGEILNSGVWQEKRKLCYPIKKQDEGMYYLINFSISPEKIAELNRVFSLNEDILRVLITRMAR